MHIRNVTLKYGKFMRYVYIFYLKKTKKNVNINVIIYITYSLLIFLKYLILSAHIAD